MLRTTGKVFSSFTRIRSQGRFTKNTSTTVSVRTVVLSPLLSAKVPTEDEEAVMDEPIKFSTSKGSHRTWKVNHSMGSQYEQPWWKVVPIMTFGMAFILWCFLRKETEIDEILKRELFQHLPGLLPDKDAEKDSKK